MIIIWSTAILSVAITFATLYLRNYIGQKAKNLAKKEDLKGEPKGSVLTFDIRTGELFPRFEPCTAHDFPALTWSVAGQVLLD